MDTINTDEILTMYEHLREGGKTVNEVIAGMGVDPKIAARVAANFQQGGGSEGFTSGFVLGLHIGQMRLDPYEYDPDSEPDCHCIFCTLKRELEP